MVKKQDTPGRRLLMPDEKKELIPFTPPKDWEIIRLQKSHK